MTTSNGSESVRVEATAGTVRTTLSPSSECLFPGLSQPDTAAESQSEYGYGYRDPAAVSALSSDSDSNSHTGTGTKHSASGSGEMHAPASTGTGEAGGVKPDLETSLNEVLSRWSTRANLVESIFGPLVPPTMAQGILLDFLRVGLLSVTRNDTPLVRREDQMDTCKEAARRLQGPAVTTEGEVESDSFRWEWHMRTRGEAESVLFFNVVAIAAYAATIRLGLPSPDASYHPPSLRFTVVPYPDEGVPAPHSDGRQEQDCRPGILAFPYDAWVSPPDSVDDAFLGPLWEDPQNPFSYISNHFPESINLDTMDSDHTHVRAFREWFALQKARNHLQLSHVCWPTTELVGETNTQESDRAVLRACVYMRQQRRSQPWMRSILGLTVATEKIGLLRADSLGLEQCVFDKSTSRGTADTARLIFGLAQSTPQHRGQHPDFQLVQAAIRAPPPRYEGQRSRDGAPGHSEMTYNCRVVQFIHLRGDKLHYSPNNQKLDVTYYIHHVIQDTDSLFGRCTRVFCVSRLITESDPPDERRRFTEQDPPHRFIGPYALKFHNANHTSGCYQKDLISVARNASPPVEHVLLPSWEWRYGDCLSMRGLGKDIVDDSDEAVQSGSDIVPAVAVSGAQDNREEVLAETDMKRMFAQLTTPYEAVAAVIDYAKAMASLEGAHLLHRDVSLGNVLLSKEEPCPEAFFADAEAAYSKACPGKIAVFRQRSMDTREGGWLHDLDMAGPLVHPTLLTDTSSADLNPEDEELIASYPGVRSFQMYVPPKVQTSRRRQAFRTGTLPFMAVSLLTVCPPHTVAHDMHSLFFVLFFFYLTYSPPQGVAVPYPQKVPPGTRPWPTAVRSWASTTSTSFLEELGWRKRTFFSSPGALSSLIGPDLHTWGQGHFYLFFVLYTTLWSGSGTENYSERHDVTPADVISALAPMLEIFKKRSA